MVSLVALTMIMNMPSTSADAAVFRPGPKATFERTAQILVWDEGRVDGQADDGDFLTDLTIPCSVKQPVLNSVANRKFTDPALILADGNSILSAIGATSPVRMNVVATFRGRAGGPTALIFPEVHLLADSSERTRALHQRGALDMISLAEDLLAHGNVVVNSQEGPYGRAHVKTFPDAGTSRSSRLAFAVEQQSRRWMTGAYLLAEVFGSALPYLANDDNDLFIRNLIAGKMNFVAGERPTFREIWPRLRRYLNAEHPERSALSPARTHRLFVKNLLRSTPEEIDREAEALCEQRSVVMAEHTLEALRQRHAGVAMISVGTLHTHGVMETLRANGVSYVVFSRNH